MQSDENALTLGSQWILVHTNRIECELCHFEQAMLNVIRHPNVNSTIILRADILKESGTLSGTEPHEAQAQKMCNGFSPELKLKAYIKRRIIPRNPLRDPTTIQSCLLWETDNCLAVIYVPHLEKSEGGATKYPFYLPQVEGVAIIYHQKSISVYYRGLDMSNGLDNRADRIALHLLQTAQKHSLGVMNGYKKRVHHDQVVDKVKFQDRYTLLKQKYAKQLVSNWVESTDPRKHVFEDLAIASFLIELWAQEPEKDYFFVDVGCGNGLLVFILLMEGFSGMGIDARARKSWAHYPAPIQSRLREEIIIPYQAKEDTTVLEDSESKISVTDTTDWPANTFIIGNHSDELTVWIPLLGHPFMVVPCCSHALTGARYRYPAKSPERASTYAALVDKVEEVAKSTGWQVEKEMLRIPSTRNAAVIGRKRAHVVDEVALNQLISQNGGCHGWLERCQMLMSKSPRDH